MEELDAHNGQGVETELSQEKEIKPEKTETEELELMRALLEEEGIEIKFPKKDEILKGTIATISEDVIMVSIGTKSEGMISGRELEQIPQEIRKTFKIGQTIPVYIVSPEDQHNNIVLSYMRAKEENDWDEAEANLKSNDIYESKVIGYNKGGLISLVGQLRGFVPASQISVLRRNVIVGDTPEQRYGKMVGEVIKVRIIEVDRSRRRLILSERQALQETRESLKDRLLDDINEGDVRNGKVTSLADFGAFVNIDGADGLVHLSEISWDRIQNPNEALKIGQEVKVKVISIDRDRKRIGLSIRQLLEDPWVQKVASLREGMLIEGKVTHLTKFGAFAKIDEEIEGLIHVSELSEQRIEHPKEVVKEGDELTLRIIKIDPEQHRIGLSLRKVDSAAYADLDWKMALSEEIDMTGETIGDHLDFKEEFVQEEQDNESQVEEEVSSVNENESIQDSEGTEKTN
jgi:small subunit ribosomal protein S1